MARNAVRYTTAVVEVGRFPGAGRVAVRTLTARMVGRFLIAVAGLAVCGSGRGMVEVGGRPGGSAVAG